MEAETDIKYSKVAQDLSEVQYVQYSYSIDFKIPKTKNNLETFHLLSLIGDTSSDPYQEIRADLNYKGHQ